LLQGENREIIQLEVLPPDLVVNLVQPFEHSQAEVLLLDHLEVQELVFEVLNVLYARLIHLGHPDNALNVAEQVKKVLLEQLVQRKHLGIGLLGEVGIDLHELRLVVEQNREDLLNCETEAESHTFQWSTWK